MADNCSEMREALEYVRDTMLELQNGGSASTLKILLVVEHALATPVRNCDVGENWLKDFYCHFKPPNGMREMPPEWVDAITEFCKWLVSPVNSRMENQAKEK